MADELDILIDKIEDDQLRAEVRAQVVRLRQRRTFGLVFEDHVPERVHLAHHPVRRGVRVVRHRTGGEPLYVRRVRGGTAELEDSTGSQTTASVDDLVVVAEFGDRIFPGLEQLGSIESGGDRPAHVVINAENHHALEMLRFTHAGKVDCIYIDPPYNTGARDWKYSNDYVDRDDAYRHSKWLAFMERRLKLARHLLKPDGVIVVTIDEHEVHRLALLLDQIFPTYRRPMVTIVMNSAGNTQNGFYRVEEHALFCFPPGTGPAMLHDDLFANESSKQRSLWGTHIRSGGINDKPSKRPNLVYPIAIDESTGAFVACGPSLEDRLDAGDSSVPKRSELNDWRPDPGETVDGHSVVWPFSQDGSLGTWRNDASTFARLVEDGFVRIRSNERAPGSNRWSISYVTQGNRRKVSDGLIPVLGREPGGALILGDDRRPVIPKTVWRRRLHDATNWGSPMLSSFVGSSQFSYPKSPYAVRDTLATIVNDRSDAVILDFFAGSGTTFHAVTMLNAADGGRRQTILVTNNEVGVDREEALLSAGHAPGSEEWERRGVFESVTRPRCEAVVTGRLADGSPVDGEYADGTPYSAGCDENVRFFKLTYQDPLSVELGDAFDAIAPMLWLRAGARGDIIESVGDRPFAVTDQYGVCFDPDSWRTFVEALPASATTAFVVTDSASIFSGVASALPTGVAAVRLFESYLETFAFGSE